MAVPLSEPVAFVCNRLVIFTFTTKLHSFTFNRLPRLNHKIKSDQCTLMAVVAMFKSNQRRWWAKLWCSKTDQCGLIKYLWAKLRCSKSDQLRMIKCSSACWTARALMMIGSSMMIKIINNIGHYSFFLMALANTDQPAAFNNVHQTSRPVRCSSGQAAITPI